MFRKDDNLSDYILKKTIASMNNVSLAESVSSGTSVATASGSDADDTASLTYSISFLVMDGPAVRINLILFSNKI